MNAGCSSNIRVSERISKKCTVIAEERYRDILCLIVNQDTEWLDLGCGRTLIREWLPNAHPEQMRFRSVCRRIVGIDAGADDVGKNLYIHEGVVGNVERLPFVDGSFSLLTAQMVVEHVADPVAMLSECWRVLRPGGSFVFITPNTKNPFVAAARFVPYTIKRRLVSRLQGRDETDVFPVHYRLNTASAISRIAKNTGFGIGQIEVLDGAPDLGSHPISKGIETALRTMLPEGMGSDLVVRLIKEA